VETGETEIQMVERHLAEGEKIIERQRELLTDLLDAEADPETAKSLLSSYLKTQSLHREHLARLIVQAG
jgi:hypothetical protein